MSDPVVPSIRDYAIDVAERVVGAFVVTLIPLVVKGSDLLHLDWRDDLSIAGFAAFLMLLKCVPARWIGEPGTASLTKAVVPRSTVRKVRAQLAAVYGRHAEKPDRLDDWPGVLEQPTRRPLGRKPPTGAPRIKLTASMVPAAAYSPPPTVDLYSKVPASTWGMDGNDAVGDCTLAEVDHSTKARQVAAGNTEVRSTAAEVLAAYSAITGYNPDKPSSDKGAVMQDVRDYWRKNGVTLGGKLDKVTLFAEVDHTDLTLIKWCVARFGAVALGINFPASAMDQFDNGQPWDVVKGSSIEGGHAISMVGYDDQYAYVITWGKVQPMTWAFFHKYVEEAWTDVSADWINAGSGEDPLGEVAYNLGEQFAQVTGQPNPFPSPPPAPEPPAPTPVPAPAPVPAIPADWVTWAKHTLTLKEQTRATVTVAQEIIAAAGQ